MRMLLRGYGIPVQGESPHTFARIPRCKIAKARGGWLGVAAFLLATMPATAQLEVDCSQTALGYGFGVTRAPGLAPRWQEFVTSHDNVRKIQLWITSEHRVDSVLRVSLADSTTAELWSTLIPDRALPSSGWLELNTPEITVVPGQKYRVNVSVDKYPNDGLIGVSVYWLGSTAPTAHYVNDVSDGWPSYSYGFSIWAAKPVPPTILRPPPTRTAEEGSACSFTVMADGTPPLRYNWFFNQTNLLTRGTNASLVLDGVKYSHTGAYVVVVSNACGAVTSSPAWLSVTPPVPSRTVPAVYCEGEVGSVLHLAYADTVAPGASWKPLDAFILTNSPQVYLDVLEALPSGRLYRAWQTDTYVKLPALQMSLATEMTLSGAPGSQVRIDFINAVGPTNAWVTLDTVTLTGSTQLYYDLTMFARPTRLYRVVPAP